MVHELLAEVFEGLSEAEANELAAAITVYTRAQGAGMASRSRLAQSRNRS